MKRIIPALLVIMLAYLTPLPPVGDCPVHGPSCVHGKSCPTAQRQLAEKAAKSCHTAHDAAGKAEVKRYRCSITSCHADTSYAISGLEVPFVVDLASSAVVPPSSPVVTHDFVFETQPSFKDISEPPEGRLLS